MQSHLFLIEDLGRQDRDLTEIFRLQLAAICGKKCALAFITPKIIAIVPMK